jgi:hypothetical protein
MPPSGIKAETGLNASAGISYNKFLAKLTSDHRKPNGQFVISPEMGAAFVETLPVGRFHGVGQANRVSQERDLPPGRGATPSDLDGFRPAFRARLRRPVLAGSNTESRDAPAPRSAPANRLPWRRAASRRAYGGYVIGRWRS